MHLVISTSSCLPAVELEGNQFMSQLSLNRRQYEPMSSIPHNFTRGGRTRTTTYVASFQTSKLALNRDQQHSTLGPPRLSTAWRAPTRKGLGLLEMSQQPSIGLSRFSAKVSQKFARLGSPSSFLPTDPAERLSGPGRIGGSIAVQPDDFCLVRTIRAYVMYNIQQRILRSPRRVP